MEVRLLSAVKFNPGKTIHKLLCWSGLAICMLMLSPAAQAQNDNTSFVPVAEEAIPNAFVRCIFKDSKGFMWLGTANGLIRYDGTNSYRYEHNPGSRTSLTNNNINVIIEDRYKNLWIGTSQGLSKYDRNSDTFTDVDSIAGNTNHLANKYITSLCFDQSERLWIGTYGEGVNIYNPKTFTFAYRNDSVIGKSPLVTSYINTILRVGDTMWVGTKGGLKLFAANTIQNITSSVLKNTLPDKQIVQLASGREGVIWVATMDGHLLRMTESNGSFSGEEFVDKSDRVASGWNSIYAMCLDGRNNLWIGGEATGLKYIDTKTNAVSSFLPDEGNPLKIPTTSIRTVYVDNTGITWIGTFNKGAYLVDNRAKKFESYQRRTAGANLLASNNVRAFAQDKSGKIWIATEEGLSVLNGPGSSLRIFDEINRRLENKNITDLLFDADDNLWIGTRGKGVYKLVMKTGKIINYELQSQGFGDGKVSCLYEDKRNVVWAGSVGSGLYYFDKKKDGFSLLRNDANPDFIRTTSYISTLLEDNDSTLWVGTYFGLYALTRRTDHSFDYVVYRQSASPGSISSSGIQALHFDRHGDLWIGTSDNGLNRLRKGETRFDVFQKKDGLPGNIISSILEDDKGNLWITGNMGLSKLDAVNNTFSNYSKDDGLTSNEFFLNSRLHSRDGKFYFGSNNGFNAFYPDSIRNNLTKPVVYLTDLKIDNQSVIVGGEESPLSKHISVTTDIVLSYAQRSFAIDFVAINYGQSSKNHYCYRLEGFEKTWNCKGASTNATYTNIDPGTYVFLVKASNSDGTWSEVPARLNITIRQAFWKTWWAILTYCVVLGSFIIFLARVRIERIKVKNQLFLEQLAREKEHQLSESKNQFFSNISHEFRTPLSLILLPLERLIANDQFPANAKDHLFTAYRSADKMLGLVNELMDFDKLENGKLTLRLQHGDLVTFINDVANSFTELAERKNIKFGIRTMASSLEGWFDRSKLEKILVNLLSNAFKFTHEQGEIIVIVASGQVSVGKEEKQSNCLKLIVIDNGIGISSEELPYIFDKFYQAESASKIANPGTGIGLSLVKGMVELLHGTITVESAPDRETRFVVTIPVDRHVFDEAEIVETPVDLFETIERDGHKIKPVYNFSPSTREKPLVLIVEDNNELRQYLASELREEFSVLEANDGQEGLEVANAKGPDLIISDVLMPRMNGVELCRNIKTSLTTSHIPFILLTARTTIEDQIQGIETGADVYITKPFSMRFLITHARQIIDSRQKLYSHFSQDVYLLPAKVASNEIDKAFLEKLVDHIVENIQNSQLGVDSIAGVFNLSRVQIYRKIKALSGKTVVEFIRTVRLKEALKLMEKKQFTLSEIAFQTGFNTPSYFTRSFKEQYGKAPSEFLDRVAE